MKTIAYFFSVMIFLGIISCNSAKKNPLVGTWKLVSSQSTLANGQPDTSVHIKNAFRVYNNSNFTVYYEYSDGKNEFCVTKYSLNGKSLSVKVLYHSVSSMIGRDLQGESYVEKDTLIHILTIDGYKISEKYKKIED